MLVRPGERVPVDYEALDGASLIDESMISGEPAPVEEHAGAGVIGGTVNKTGAFPFRATKVGAATLLSNRPDGGDGRRAASRRSRRWWSASRPG